ncbi:pyridoxamine 5'-phosphate oxidase family protein [Candidatus Saccharibacteria bacterium]|jgi:general stress protein 26|nr:pyridoxamine 5'-phosphate oxidase family protein [Candidatus Saccharibacteria bacterium]
MSAKSNFKNPNIASFLKRNHIAVIATANKETGAPHAAAVYYATDSQMNIFFVTKEDTTKSKNLTANPQVALAIYEAAVQATAQITGTVTRVEDPVMLQKALRIMSKHARETAKTDEAPYSKLNAGQYVLYKIWPQTIRLGEYKYGPHNQIFDIATPAEESLE